MAFLKHSLVAPALAWLVVIAAACRTELDPGQPPPPRTLSAAPQPSLLEPRPVRPIASEVVAAKKQLQASKLALVPPRARLPRLAFGRGVLGQLTDSELCVYDTKDFKQLGRYPLEAARALVTLADGALLAVGSKQMIRFEPGNKKVSNLPRPTLLPGAELIADAVSADRIWVFEAGGGSASAGRRPKLSSMLLTGNSAAVLLPEREVELELDPGGVLGTTREGVWLYISEEHAERLGPSGARLSKLRLPKQEELLWMLPARRLDQSLLVDRHGGVSRAVVSPSFKQLSKMRLSAPPWSMVVGDQGRLVAAIVMASEGPRFELELLDAELSPLGRAQLPGEAPTGGEDWIQVVTRNQGLAAAAHEPRVAVGGPDRVLVFDGQGTQLFSIPSR